MAVELRAIFVIDTCLAPLCRDNRSHGVTVRGGRLAVGGLLFLSGGECYLVAVLLEHPADVLRDILAYKRTGVGVTEQTVGHSVVCGNNPITAVFSL